MRVVDHGRYIMGPEVGELEQRLASYCGVEHVVTCSSGTDALLLVLMAWEVGPGDAVFVPSFTFTSTAEVVALLGATPVFCDVKEDTFNLDPRSLKKELARIRAEGTLRPKAVIPVDLFGQPADYDAINEIAVDHGLHVLADAAQSFGARQNGQVVGSLAEATATSFFPAKPLGCYGDGGAVFTNDAELEGVMRSLRIHGKGLHKYDTVRVGLNARLDTMQAAVLLVKLDSFDEELSARQRVAALYSDLLGGLVITPEVDEGATSAWAQYTIRVRSGGGNHPGTSEAGDGSDRRDAIADALRAQGIPTAVYYPRPLHQQPAFADNDSVRLPISETLSSEVLSLPMGPYIGEGEIHRVSRALHQVADIV